MSAKRRSVIRAVGQLQASEQLPSPEVVDRLELSRLTAVKRMDSVDTSCLAATVTETRQGGETKVIGPTLSSYTLKHD